MEKTRRPLLTAREAVTYLGISLSTLNRIEKQGSLVPFRTPGLHRRYDLKMLDEYLEATRLNSRKQGYQATKHEGRHDS